MSQVYIFTIFEVILIKNPGSKDLIKHDLENAILRKGSTNEEHFDLLCKKEEDQ